MSGILPDKYAIATAEHLKKIAAGVNQHNFSTREIISQSHRARRVKNPKTNNKIKMYFKINFNFFY